MGGGVLDISDSGEKDEMWAVWPPDLRGYEERAECDGGGVGWVRIGVHEMIRENELYE